MTILIKGMEMPSKGCKTINIHADGTVYVHGAYPTELHIAIPVPTSHGRLIDVKALERMDFSSWIMQGDVGYVPFMEVSAAIFNAPTVIEAEEG